MPVELNRWVYEKEGTYRSVNLNSCVEEYGIGYTCGSGVIETSHICLDPKEGKCHYRVSAGDYN